MDRLHAALFSTRNSGSNNRLEITWEDCIRDICSVPAKVANAVLGAKGEVPLLLENKTYFDNVSLRCEALIFTMSTKRSRGMHSCSLIEMSTLLISVNR